MAETQTTNATSKYWDFLTRATVPVAILIAGMVLRAELRLAALEDSQFTAKELMSFRSRLLEAELPEIKNDIIIIKLTAQSIEERVKRLESRGDGEGE